MKLFARPGAVQNPRVPDGIRVYAIGDVHGCLRELRLLLAQIEQDDREDRPAETHVVMIGDLVDRGPDSAGVIEFFLSERPDFATFHFLMGNHEAAMLESLADGADPRGSGWLRFGGRAALRSYGVPEEAYDLQGRLLRDEFARYVPDRHLEFMRSFQSSVQFGDYLFVHAGIRPGRALNRQSHRDLISIREPFLTDPRAHTAMVVHGHTISRDVDRPGNRIGIDTGAYISGVLTALGLHGSDQWLLQTEPRPGRANPLPR